MFDDLHDPDPPKPGLDTLARVSSRAQRIRRRRSMTIARVVCAVVALVAAVLVLPRIGDGDRVGRITAVDSTTVDSTVAGGTVVDTTVVDDTAVPTPTTVASTAAASTDTASSVAPASGCAAAARPPVYLVDGSSPEDATLTTNTDGTVTATWGDGTSKVIQGLGADAPFVDSPNTISRGDFTATIVPVGDDAVGQISIVIADAAEGCERHYWVGPGIDPDQAIAYATQWIAYLDVDRSLTIEETADQACVSSSGAPVHCLDVPRTDVNYPIAGGNVGKVDDGVWTLLLLVSKGADAAPLSSLVRRFPLARNPDLELLVDVIPPHESCGRVTAPDGASSNWAIGGRGESTCGRPSAVVDPVVPLVAIDANGDAVLIEALDGTATVLSDGPDPDDPPLAEGDVTTLDSVAISPDRTIAIVSSCCEPIIGSMSRVDLATGAETFYGFGHLPSFTSSGNLVWEVQGTIGIGDSGDQSAVLLEIDPSEGTVVDLATVSIDGLDLVLVIVTGPSGTTLWRIMAAGGDMQMSAPISTATWTDNVQYSLAGWLDGSIFVLDESNDRMLTFDAETLESHAVPDVANLSISTWVEPGRSVTIDDQRQLFVNNVHVPGEYLWAR